MLFKVCFLTPSKSRLIELYFLNLEGLADCLVEHSRMQRERSDKDSK